MWAIILYSNVCNGNETETFIIIFFLPSTALYVWAVLISLTWKLEDKK